MAEAAHMVAHAFAGVMWVVQHLVWLYTAWGEPT